MDALSSLRKGKVAVFAFVYRATHSLFNILLFILSRLYLYILLLGLSSHPRIAGRLWEVEGFIKSRGHKGHRRRWDKFVKSVMDDYKLVSVICSSVMLMDCVAAKTAYNTDLGVTAVALIAAIPPIFGTAQAICLQWHLKSIYIDPNAPRRWCKVSEHNAASPFFQTAALLAAPVAWMCWSLLSFMALLLVILFRGLPISTCVYPESPSSSAVQIIQILSIVCGCESQDSPQALDGLSMASRGIIVGVIIIGIIHLGITITYFTKLGLPQAATFVSNTFDMPRTPIPSPQDTPTIHTAGPTPTEIFHTPTSAFPSPSSQILSPNTAHTSATFTSPSSSYDFSIPVSAGLTVPTLTLPTPIITKPPRGPRALPHLITEFPTHTAMLQSAATC